jgi:hypothetical protein
VDAGLGLVSRPRPAQSPQNARAASGCSDIKISQHRMLGWRCRRRATWDPPRGAPGETPDPNRLAPLCSRRARARAARVASRQDRLRMRSKRGLSSSRRRMRVHQPTSRQQLLRRTGGDQQTSARRDARGESRARRPGRCPGGLSAGRVAAASERAHPDARRNRLPVPVSRLHHISRSFRWSEIEPQRRQKTQTRGIQ